MMKRPFLRAKRITSNPAMPAPAPRIAPLLLSPRRFIRGLAGIAAAFLPAIHGAVPMVALDASTYQTEHCLFVIDSTVTWGSPATAYNDIYASPFTRIKGHFATLTTRFPAAYFSICYMANTGQTTVPNYIDQIYKATGISTGLGSAGLGTTGDPNTPQSFSSVDFCRYNLTGQVFTPAIAVYDHELGHAWGVQFFNNVSGVGPGILGNGHWLANTTIDCQLGATYSADGGVSVNKIYGTPAEGFRYQRVDNLRSNDVSTFSEQQLYLMGLRETFPTTYALNSPVYQADLTMTAATVETYTHADGLARYGPRNPDYKVSPKKLRLGFVYIARDLAEINAVYQAIEQSIIQFTTGEVIDSVHYRFQVPFLVDTHYRATVDAKLSDLDGVATPTLSVTDTYVASASGTAVVNFVAADASGPAPVVSLVPAATQASVAGSTVNLAGLPDGVHFFTIKAENSAGKKAFGHFVVEVSRPASTTTVSTQPLSQTVTGGGTAIFSVAASGAPATYTYQWFRQAARSSTWNTLIDGGGFSGSTTSSLSVTGSTALDGDHFLCVVTNAAGTATSNAAGLVVTEIAPAFVTQPADRTVPLGSVANFSVSMVGAPLAYGYFGYQWQRKPAGTITWSNLVDGGGIVGSLTASLAVNGTTLAMSGDAIRCIVTNTSGASTSGSATLSINQPPAIVTQPQNVSAAAGATVSFTVVASGTAPLSYQWLKYSTPITGANSATLTLTNVQAADAAAYVVTITNVAGSAGSNAASLTVTGTSAPTISAHPQSLAVLTGATANFSVTATGTAPLAYQWSKGGSPIAGAVASSFSIPSAQLGDAGNYSVTVSNSAGAAISGTAVLTVTVAAVAPTITTQPQGVAVLIGAGASFSVVVNGTSPLTYQWRLNTNPIAGANSATYSIASPQLSDAGSYTVTISNSAGTITSAAANLSVSAAPPSVVTQPVSISVLTGASATFSVVASGTAPLTYQWSKAGGAISGATGSSLVLSNVQASDAGNYTVTISNAGGSVTSAPATLAVTASVIAPTISTQPHAVTVIAGSSASFSVLAGGTSPFTYQWSRNSAPINGATSATFAIASAQPADAGNYAVTVSNSAGSAISANALLTVTSVAVAIASQPQNSTAAMGGTVSFSVIASGTPPFSYQWYKDGMPIAGAISANLTLSAVTAADAGIYHAVVTGGSGSVSSQPATLSIAAVGALPTTLLANLSVRTTLGAGQKLIPGFVTTGNKILLLRLAGPTLTALGLGLSGLPDPTLQVFDSASRLIAENDDWDPNLTTTFSQLGAFPFSTGGKDSAVVATLSGPNSAFASGKSGDAGIVLMELYDTQVDYANRLVNVSARNRVGTGADVLILGFVITGTGTKQLLIRGVGPALTAYGVAGALANPTLDLLDVAGATLAHNDDWDAALAATFSRVGAFALEPGSKDAALVVALPPGIYSVRLSGFGGTTGEALAEVYEIWP
ncbi:MAG: hypothetical protein JWM32_656 [Verrucomicrobia bacterium]|nr:hypothetical protein [Verrucomicrobiota bacterium]